MTALGASVPALLTPSTGAIYYVDKDAAGASDANAGTSAAAPWLTVNHGMQTAPANSIVYVKKAATAYSETIAVTANGGSGSSNPITVAGYDPLNPPTIKGSVELQGVTASHWRFQDLIVDANAAATFCFKVDYTGGDSNAANVGAHHIQFKKVTCSNTHLDGGCWLITGSDVHNIYWWNCLAYAADITRTGAHGFYLNGGTQLHLMNCISRDNGGYGYQVYLDAGRNTLQQVFFYNCIGVSEQLRGGWVVQGDNATAATIPQDIHCYNCISAFNNEGTDTQQGWIYRAANVSDFTGFTADSLVNCLSYSNLVGDVIVENASIPLTQTSLLTGKDPRFTDLSGKDFTITSGTPARSEPATVVANNLEGGTNGVGITTGNSGGTSGTAFTHVSAGTGNTVTYSNVNKQGTLSAKFTFGGTSTGEAGWNTLGSLTGPVWIRAVFAVSALPIVGQWFDLVSVRDNATARCAAITLRTDGLIRIDNASGTQINALTGSTVIAANTLYRVEAKITPSATVGAIEWWLYTDPTLDINSYSDHHSASSLVLGANIDGFWFGNPSTAADTAGLSGYFDSLALSTTDQLGPAGGAAFIPNPCLAAGNAATTPPTDFNSVRRGAADLGAYAFTVASNRHTGGGGGHIAAATRRRSG